MAVRWQAAPAPAARARFVSGGIARGLRDPQRPWEAGTFYGSFMAHKKPFTIHEKLM